MTRANDVGTASDGETRRDRIATGGVMGGHGLVHLYMNGFYVILPELYHLFGMNPVTAGAVDAVRRIASGTASMVGGFVLDRYPDKRVPVLYLSLICMGVGYALVGLAPSYVLLLVAIAVAGAASSIWHPAAIGLLSVAFPERRGFVISFHRAVGSVGDVIGPLLVGALLVVLSARAVLAGSLPLAVGLGIVLWVLLVRAPRWHGFRTVEGERRSFRDQFRALGPLARHRGLRLLVLVKFLAGIGQGGLVMWIGLYLAEVEGVGSVGVAVHIALLTGVGIVVGPWIGALSDRIGRKPVITGVLAVKALVAICLAIVPYGLVFSLLVAAMGAVMFGANSLIQVAALDIGDGQQLEGSLVGLMWGVNALSGGSAPLVVGALIAALGYGVLFWFVAAANVLAMLSSFTLPTVRPAHAKP